MEWGDRFAAALPEQGLIVRIGITDDEERTLEVEPLGERGARLAGDWVGACAGLDGVVAVAGGGAV